MERISQLRPYIIVGIMVAIVMWFLAQAYFENKYEPLIKSDVVDMSQYGADVSTSLSSVPQDGKLPCSELRMQQDVSYCKELENIRH